MMRKSKTAAKTAAALLLVASVCGHTLPAQAGSGSTTRNAQTRNVEDAQAFWKKAMEANSAAMAAFAERMAVASAGQAAGREAGSLRKATRSPYDAMIARHAAAHSIPVSLAHAVIRVESNYRPNARGRAGEIGLMQIKAATARGLGYSGSAKGLYDPDTNLRYGMKYLGEAYRLGGGDICTTILKYNAGHGARRMNARSSAYCSEVKRRMASTRAP